MANIVLTLPVGEAVYTGKQITFPAPCDCKTPEGVVIGEQSFNMVDAAGNNVLGTEGVFIKDALISIVLDCENSKAYIQNAASGATTGVSAHLADTTVHLTSAERTKWNSASTNSHTHSNKTVLDNTTASYTTAEKTKLSGIATGANAYTHPSYTARTGVPTGNQTPVFGGAFNVCQPVCDSTGHVTALTSRTVTIPKTEATTSAAGLMSASDKTKLNSLSTGSSYLPTTGGTINGNLDVTGTLAVAQGGALSVRDTSGNPRTVAKVDNSNYLRIGTGKYSRTYIGDSTNTARMHICSKGRIDFLANGATDSDALSMSIVYDGDMLRFRPTVDGSEATVGYMSALGSDTYPFSEVYAVSTDAYSDARVKNTIENLDPRYLDAWDKFIPRTYFFNIDDLKSDKKKHVGLIAQEVEQAILDAGLTYEECAFLGKHKHEQEDGTVDYNYTLKYENISILTMAKVKELEKEYNTKIHTLEEKYSELEAKYNELLSRLTN